jgi:SAM-dependent methyltransferase
LSYADITVNDPNPVKRWMQRTRYADAVHVAQGLPEGDRQRILDYGGGNGELVKHLLRNISAQACVFEPTPDLMAEAQSNLAGIGSITFCSTSQKLSSGSFDLVFCLEVLEHLPENETTAALGEIDRLLRPRGTVVFGVPHEIHLPALFKGLFRMSRRFGKFDARWGNVCGAVIGKPPKRRPSSEISPGFLYHFDHLGFDYRKLRDRIKDNFQFEREWFSPFPHLGSLLNSEVYFLARRKA